MTCSPSRFRVFAVLLTLGVTAACMKKGGGDSPTTPTTPAPTTTQGFFSAAADTNGGTAFYSSQSAPAASGGPTATILQPPGVPAGSAFGIQVSASTSFQKVLISVGGTTGYQEIDLTAPVQLATVTVTTTSDVLNRTFNLQVQIGTGGSIGPVSTTIAQGVSLSSAAPFIIAFFFPNPAPWIGGGTCSLPLSAGTNACAWQAQARIVELGGVGVNISSFQSTTTFGGTTPTFMSTPHAFLPNNNTTIQPASITGFNVGWVCLGENPCVKSEFGVTAGSFVYTVTGTDTNGKPFTFTSPTLTLSAAP